MTKIAIENNDSEREAWLSLLSSYIISRTKHFLSSETRTDGRTLVLLSGLVILISLRFVSLQSADLSIATFTINSYANIIIELVGFYYLVSFLIDAKNDRKIWEFEILKDGRSTSDPLYIIKKDHEWIIETKKSIISKYEQIMSVERVKYGLNESFESIRSPKDTSTETEFLEKSVQNHKQFMIVFNDIQSRERNELEDLKPTELFINFKLESYNLEIQKVVKSFKTKYRFAIMFPVTLYIVSIVVTLISLFWIR